MHKILHVVPDVRYGGIFRYIEMQLKIFSGAKFFLFSNQPNIKSINYLPFKVFHLRLFYSPLILLDLLLNTPFYLYGAVISDEIFFHTPFCIFHHLLLRRLGFNSYIYIHDYNIPSSLCFFLTLSKRVYVVSPALKKDFPSLFSQSLVKPPCYDLDRGVLLNNSRTLKVAKSKSILFLGNINRVKQIAQYAYYLEELSFTSSDKFNLDLYGEIVSVNAMKSILAIRSKHITINHSIPPDSVNSLIKKYDFLVIPSKSEVFPLVYYEALKNGVIPLVNNISFFSLCTSLKLHIFNLEDRQSFKNTHEWALSLTDDDYLIYHKQLLLDFFDFYQSVTSNNDRS